MIIAFVGTPGSGKSYDAMNKIIDNIKAGRRVYTNVEGLDLPEHQELIKNHCKMNDEQWKGKLNFIDEKDLPSFWTKCEAGSLIVLDELHKVFRNREWSSTKNIEFANWASTHRHHGYDLILLTQFLESIEKGVRELVEWTYRYKKLNVFGGFIQKFTQSYVKFAYSGNDINKEPIQRVVSRYDKKIFPLYKSYANADTKELGIMTTGNALVKPIFIAIPVCFILFFFLASKASFITGKGGFFGKDNTASASVPQKQKKDLKQKEKEALGERAVDDQNSKPLADRRGVEAAVRVAINENAPKPESQDKKEQLWGATVYQDSNDSEKKLVFEGNNYVGWYKVHRD